MHGTDRTFRKPPSRGAQLLHRNIDTCTGERAMFSTNVLKAIDWFIPGELRTNKATLWRARIFVISHLLGPWSAVVILSYLYRALETHDVVFWSITLLCSLFWLLPLALKLTRAFLWVALLSICILTFVSVFGSFFYGGVSSPFLPWFLTALLLGFFYLGDRPLLVLAIFGIHLSGFCIAYLVNGAFPLVLPVRDLSTVGVVSVCAATLYTSMMAIYYAYVMTAQSALRQEIERHLITAEKLLKAKRNAERANEAKTVFLAKMNHQLRTPLNAIIGYSEILLDEIEPNPSSEEMNDLRQINSAGRHLLSLVSDVLNVKRIDSEDADQLTMCPVHVSTFISEVASTCHFLATNNGNEFVVTVDKDLDMANIDETKLRQVLINLLSNAGKFTSKGKITLRASRAANAQDERLTISVEDNGIGMPPDALRELFTDFSKASALTSRLYGGSGLGLAVSNKLCRLMGGEISVESERGKGSVFTVKIPSRAQLLIAA
jgi:signal transduction histidine kinase